MTCNDCIHYDVCDEYGMKWVGETLCHNHKDKPKFIELPCKVGDMVYAISTGKPSLIPFGKIVNGKLNSFYITENGIFASGVGFYRNISEFGKTVFFTREEAEKALKECENNA